MADRKSAKNAFKPNTKAEEVAARLPELDLEARDLASLIYGLRKRNKPGTGIEFDRFTPYQQGFHDPRKIDHKASARRQHNDGSDFFLIRERQMEVAQTFYLWLDRSRSMDFKAPEELFPDQPKFTKQETGIILTLASAYLAAAAGEYFTLLGSGLGLSGNKSGVQRILQEIEHGGAESAGQELPKLPHHRGKPLPRGSHVLIFSDFLCPREEIGTMIESLHHAGVKGHLIQILDPAEVEFRYKGRVRLESMEDEFHQIVGKGELAKAEMEQLVKDHINDIHDMVAAIPGWKYSCHVTDRPLYEALLPLYGIKTKHMPAGAPRPVI